MNYILLSFSLHWAHFPVFLLIRVVFTGSQCIRAMRALQRGMVPPSWQNQGNRSLPGGQEKRSVTVCLPLAGPHLLRDQRQRAGDSGLGAAWKVGGRRQGRGRREVVSGARGQGTRGRWLRTPQGRHPGPHPAPATAGRVEGLTLCPDPPGQAKGACIVEAGGGGSHTPGHQGSLDSSPTPGCWAPFRSTDVPSTGKPPEFMCL